MYDGVDDKPFSRKLWICAAIAALVLHVGGAAIAVARLQQSDSENDLGAPGIEIGLELASPNSAATDLPAGPDSDAAAASPAVTAQKETFKETELPKDRPTETENPDRIVSPTNSNKPQEENPNAKSSPAPPSIESAASEATAMPKLEMPTDAVRSITREQGTGESSQRIRATWQKELVAHLDKHKRYPSDRSSKSAEILVQLILDRVGRVVSVSVTKGSGDIAFDEAAIAMVRRSDPVPAPPPLVADDGLTFQLPVKFRPKNRG